MKRRFLKNVGRAVLVFFVGASAHAAQTDIAPAPLVTSSASAVRPNMMFVLDDSGSMGDDFLPDWATTNDQTLFRNNVYNGVAYSAAVTYSPPIAYDTLGGIDTTTYRSMTSANSAAWASVKDDAYGVQATTTSNLNGAASFYTFVAGEYCDKTNLRNCVLATAPTGAFTVPATLRWCTSNAMSNCQAVRVDAGATTYLVPRYPPLAATATIRVLNTNSITITVAAPASPTSTSVTGITVNGTQIMKAATTSGTSTSTLATGISNSINTCMADTTTCNAGGARDYVATVSGSVVTVTGSNIASSSVVVTNTPTTSKVLTFAVANNPTTPTTVSGITVGGTQLLSATTAGSTNINTVAANIAAGINLCHTTTACDKGYTATALNDTVTVTAQMGITNLAVMTKGTGSMTFSITAFNGGTIGSNVLTNIVSGTTSYPYPGTAVKSTTRTDCAGTTCTFAEEMTNYANWWAYYHTRMQMMKTSASLAFQSVGQNYRVGYSTINHNQVNGFVNLGTFETTATNQQKRNWYLKLFAAVPNNSTPLRTALAETGRLYAGKYNGSSIDGVAVTDPMQFSCQQNFTILSTDGYWNEAPNPNKLDGSADVGNQDAAEPRPFSDGGGSIVSAATPTRTVVRTQTVTNQTITTVFSRFNFTVGAVGADSGCSKRMVHQQEQRQTETKSITITSLDDAIATSTRTVVTTNGAVTSDTTSKSNSNVNVSTNTVTNSDPFTPFADFGAYTTTGSCLNSPTPQTPNPSNTTTVSSTTANTSAPVITPVSTTGPTAGATVTTIVSTSGGTANTLADVAEYYYINDLRTVALGNCTGATGNTLCSAADPDPFNNVPASGLDGASWQHMTTFTLGLGASGFMQFSPNYAGDTSGDFFDVKNGTLANPAGGVCSWQTSGACNWPPAVSNTQTTIDDLWHAAVNGRGTYFSATNPASLKSGLSSALAGVSTRTGSSAAATTSNPNVTSGDNFVFSSTFTSQEWTGELVRQQLDLVTGAVSSAPSSPTCAGDWCAQGQLDTNAARVLYTFDGTTANKLKPFAWANLTAAEQANFTTPNISSLSQLCVAGVCVTNQPAAAGSNLVNFLRGDRTNEGFPADTTKFYRRRVHVLGDIVNAEAVYVKRPLFNYADAGYSAFIAAQATRQGMVYVAANDGMVHGFNSDTGAEAFTYVPSLVLPNLYKLADQNYANLHQYFVDGTPIEGDVFFGGAWHTIVVGGLNAGGRGYYALDVTDPAAPKAMWEFTDTNMGFTFGNPTITKLQDGTWVVLVTSGYNNVAPGDGVGRLYVINASTGALIRTISTGVGSTTTPSGLAHVSAWVDNTTADNTALRAYGGDMLGNLWRFDINNNVGAAGFDAQLLVQLFANTAGTITQPITTRPELGDVGGVAVVFVGTGRFLGAGDLSDTTQQTFYAVKDTLGAAPTPCLASSPPCPMFANPKATGTTFVQQTLTTGTCPTGSPASICSTGQTVRTSSSNTVNFAINAGWFVNLPDVGERSNTDPTLALGTLGFTTNVPSTDACTAGGFSFRYLLDFRTGAPVSTSTTGVSAIKLGNALATRAVFVRLPNNTVVQLTRLSDGTTTTTNVPIGAGIGPTRRVSWRELIQDQ